MVRPMVLHQKYAAIFLKVIFCDFIDDFRLKSAKIAPIANFALPRLRKFSKLKKIPHIFNRPPIIDEVCQFSAIFNKNPRRSSVFPKFEVENWLLFLYIGKSLYIGKPPIYGNRRNFSKNAYFLIP